jgi:hypothetical protein
MPYTSDDLVIEVRRRSRLPSATDLSDAEILQYADQEMQTTIADVIRNASASFWVTTYEVALTASVSSYTLPRRAIGAGVERVELEDSAGRRLPIVAVSEEDTWRWASGGRDPHWPGEHAFTLEGEALRLWPTPSASGSTLRVRYQRQPSRLVPVSECGALNGATDTVTISTSGTPPAWLLETSDVDRYLDIARGDGVHDLIIADAIGEDYSDPTLTLSASTPLEDAASIASISPTGGRTDYVCKAGTTCYPQIPSTLWPLLVSKTTVAVLEALGDREGMAAAQATANQREAAARSVVTPRSREAPRFINRTSYLRRG